jgi:hypothetical protein
MGWVMVLTIDEMRRRLRRFRYDPENGNRRRPSVSITTIASLSRIDIQDLREFLVGRPTSVKKALGATKLGRLEQVLRSIDEGRIRCVGRSGVEYREPPTVRPPSQDKFTRHDSWREWCRCRTCGGDKWRSVECHGAFYYTCNQCCGPDSWAAMGARRTTKQERETLPESAMTEQFQ